MLRALAAALDWLLCRPLTIPCSVRKVTACWTGDDLCFFSELLRDAGLVGLVWPVVPLLPLGGKDFPGLGCSDTALPWRWGGGLTGVLDDEPASGLAEDFKVGEVGW